MAGQSKENTLQIATLDADWVNLMTIARNLGISKETVKAFLEEKRFNTTAKD